MSARPFCAEVSSAAAEPLGATASRIEHWLLVEYAGMWPYDPLDAAPFVGGLRRHLEEQLASLPNSRLLLVKQPTRTSPRRTRVFVARTSERDSLLLGTELPDIGALVDVDLAAVLEGDDASTFGEPVAHPLLVVCTHGKRDRCCARFGQPLCVALHRQVPGSWLWQSSHVGGDRFAGNVVCLPEGLYYGRVGRKDVPGLVDAHRAGRIALDHYRGRSCYSFPIQAGELAARRELGLTGFWDLRLAAARRQGDGWIVELVADVSGVRCRVEVGVELRDEEFLTCSASEMRRARRWAARSVDVDDAQEALAHEPADEHDSSGVVEPR
jgi:hypothetical protein